jgi:DNA ligase-1
MKQFAALFTALDATTSTRDKLDALVAYFSAAAPRDAAWAAYFLAGGKQRQLVPTRVLATLARERAGLPEWLFEESYHAVGDLAETIAHVLPPATRTSDVGLGEWVEERLLPLRGLEPQALAGRLADYWDELDWNGRFLLVKLIGGGFRVGVARQLVVRALATVAGIDHKRIAQRMVGWTDSRDAPSAARFQRIVAPEDSTLPSDLGLPYPFFLAHPLQDSPAGLGAPGDWLAEWKWDGIRGQLIKRRGRVWLWSRGEELITERFPEIAAVGAALPDGTVLDGEILAWAPGGPTPLPFARLQPRITRKTLTKAVLASSPAVFVAYDLLEQAHEDLRALPLQERRARLDVLVGTLIGTLVEPPVEPHIESLLEPLAEPLVEPLAEPLVEPLLDSSAKPRLTQPTEPPIESATRQHVASRKESPVEPFALARPPAVPPQMALRLSPVIVAESWEALGRLQVESRARGVEGLMLKQRASHYGVGRTKASGQWWKWKIDPYSVDAVLIYAQRGHGRRASLYTDFTFAVWQPGAAGQRTLVPFAKAYSGLTDEEMRRVDAVVRKTTIEKFGPVRSVEPSLVFELGFEAIQPSPRHKSGVAVRFPRILRWRTDKRIEDADTLATLQGLLHEHAGGAVVGAQPAERSGDVVDTKGMERSN